MGRRSCEGGVSYDRKSRAATTLMVIPGVATMLSFGLAALVLLCTTGSVMSNEIRGLGFYPPFQTFSARGERTVPSFTLGGDAVVKQSFARITPDETGRFGNMYSRLTGRFNAETPEGQFSLAMTFRVSGGVEKAHGKHLAVVIGAPDAIRRRGETYGLPEDFVGVGVVISPRAPADMSEPTANPSRPNGPRQFVSFFANNGTRTTEDVRALANSCASTVRYYEKRDDFNFLKSSRVRLGYLDGMVTLEVDSRNIGVWRKCISTKVPDMPPGWLERAGVTITSQTGVEVSNHHDVMSLEVFTERDEAFNEKVVDGTVVDEDGGDAAADAAARKQRLYTIRAHLEHEFDSVERILKDSVAKLASVNEDILRRLTKLEKDISTEAFAILNSRVKDMEGRVTKNAAPALENRIQVAEEDFRDEMGQSLEKLLRGGSGWKLSFCFMLAMVAALFTFSVKQYRRLMRANFLGGMR